MSLAYYIKLLLEVMLPMVLLVAAGAAWRRSLGENGVKLVRGYISTITINLFAPALLFAAAASADITTELLSVPLLLGLSVLFGFGVLYFVLFHTRIGANLAATTRAGLLLCGIFGNVLFMGFPLLHFLFGDEGGRYAAFADMGAATPLLWSLGVWIAIRFGGQVAHQGNPVKAWLMLPPVWSFMAGIVVSLMGWEVKPIISASHFIGQPTVPVMLLMLGLSIPWSRLAPNRAVLSVAMFKLLVLPFTALLVSWSWFGTLRDAQIAAVIETGVPTMLMALSVADRYQLDVEMVALTIAWSTVLFLFTLPLWLLILI
ncbi:AEC family transporter [Sulfuriferula thiophila]|uniref:AEC family transporter n=1 Tax=Sulfuriferula thiophila TaxID=1781211 RepID=UPI000F60E2E5|nr:AEC family transporter [Sulfuriferula thiophila]